MTDLEFLKTYDGPKVNIMEICGSHTAAISKSGLRSVISPNINLISGPGCPVCVTASSYIDKLVELGEEGKTIATFGDMIRVVGSKESLSQARGRGVKVLMLYAPNDLLKIAKEHPEEEYVFAAVGFETTTPAYALLLEDIISENITNIKLLTSLKTMPAIVRYLMENGPKIDAFLAPGHVCAVTGSDIFMPLAKKYGISFGVTGFEPEELVRGLAGTVRLIGENTVGNFYEKAVDALGSAVTKALVDKYFTKADATLKGIGIVKDAGLVLRKDYEKYDAGSHELNDDKKAFSGCCCGEILLGRKKPSDCPLFKKACTPLAPKGACMVSEEGACHTEYSI